MLIGGVDIDVVDEDPFYDQVVHEVENIYKFDTIPFKRGDVVLDIGAHVGLVSIYLAKLNPGITVHAFEPVEENFERLRRHIKLNDATNVHAHNLAVTADGGERVMVRGAHSGGATAFHAFERPPFTVKSTTVPKILARHKIDKVRLLKLDCEGAEHEILAHSADWIGRVQHIRGEIHNVPVNYDAQFFARSVPDVLWTFA